MSYNGQIWVPPISNNFTNVNFNTGATANSVNNAIELYVPKASGSNNLIGQSYNAPSTPYCAIANIDTNIGNFDPNTNSIIIDFGFYDGTKFVLFQTEFGPINGGETLRYGIIRYSNTTTFSATQYGYTIYPSGYAGSAIRWIQIRDDGTNIYFYIASDGGETQPKHWVKLYQEARTTYLSNVNKIFWGCNSYFNGCNTYLTLNSFQTISL